MFVFFLSHFATFGSGQACAQQTNLALPKKKSLPIFLVSIAEQG